LKRLSYRRVEPQLARHCQIKVVLQTSPQVRQLNCGNWSGNAAVLLRVQLLFARIDQDAVTVGEVLIIARLVRLAAIVEGDWIDPDVLDTFTLLLTIMFPNGFKKKETIL